MDRSLISSSSPCSVIDEPSKKVSMKENRCLMAQSEAWGKNLKGDSNCVVAELFSPPRFSEQAKQKGKTGLSFDILQGWDLTKTRVQKRVDETLELARPDLLVVCPPCKHWGGWYHLNQQHLTLLQRCVNQQLAHKQANFAVDQIKKQLNRGGRVIVEHPWRSGLWQYAPMAKLLRTRLHLVRTDLCAYELTDPDSGLPILKPTGIAVSHEDMKELALTCPGHPVHKPVEGRCLDGENLSVKTSRYTPEFCNRWLSCVLPEHQLCHFACLEETPTESPQLNDDLSEEPADVSPADITSLTEALAAASEPPLADDKVVCELRKLHNNLGHPTNWELIRVLRNAGGSEQAIKLAAELKCDVCFHRQRPAPC